jgi:iron complex outermembrane recepter protein
VKFLSLSLAGSAALAAAAPENLAELVVQADSATPTLTVPSAADSRRELAETAGGTELIEAERYLRGRASTVADTFALSAGIIAQPRFGSDEARLSIRGSGLQRTFHGRGIRVLQDGVPINLADGSFDFQALDPLAASYIRVWRGANAFAYGSSTLGGAIDYVTHTGFSAPAFSARIEVGAFDYLRARIAGSYAEGPRDLYFSLSQHSQDGFREHSAQNNQRLFTQLGWRLHDQLESRLYLTTVFSDSELPGNLTKAELEDDPRQADRSRFGALRYDNKRDFQLHRLASKTTLTHGATVWDLSAAWTYKDLDHPITPFAGVLDQLSNDLLLGLTSTHTADLFGRENKLRGGILYTRGRTDAAVFENLLGSRGDLRSLDQQTATNLEAFLENQHPLGAGFTGILGLAASRNVRENDRRFQNPATNPPFYNPPAPGARINYQQTYTDVSPKAGIRWDGPGIQAYANLSGSYEPPSFSETITANTARRAQEAVTFEIGTRGTRGPARWDASLYYAEIENELLALVDPLTLTSTTTNANDTLHAGLELAGEFDLLGHHWDAAPDHRLVFRSAWTYGRFRFDNDPTYGNNRIAGLPPHLIRGELTWENRAGYYAGPTFEWAPVPSYIDHRNTFSADPHALLGFKLGRRLDTGLSWFIEARNLTDERYAATTGVIENANSTDQRQFLPGDGRSVFAGLEWKW